MKSALYFVGLSFLMAGLTSAQTPPAQDQAPATSQAQSNPTDSTQSTKKAQREAAPGGTTTQGTAMPAVKTENFKGALIDAACAGGGSTSSSAAADSKAAAPADKDKADNQKTESNAAAGNQGQACQVSASTSQFALRLKDNRTLKFDSVGNMRAQEALKNEKKWSQAVSSGKPIQAKVSGVVNGDVFTVMSID